MTQSHRDKVVRCSHNLEIDIDIERHSRVTAADSCRSQITILTVLITGAAVELLEFESGKTIGI